MSSNAASTTSSKEPWVDGAAGGRSFGGSYLTGMWTLYVLTLRQHLHGRRWMVMGLLFLVPAALALLMRATAEDVPPLVFEFSLAMLVIPQALLPLVALVYASGIVQDEQEEQTFTYLLIRPIPRWAIYLVKWAATATTTAVLTATLTLVTYAAVYLGAADAPDDVVGRAFTAAAIHALAVVAYCSLFGLMSLIVRRILIAGILYIVVIEGVLANFPFGIRLATVIYYARRIAYPALPFLDRQPEGRVIDMAAEAWNLDLVRDPKLLEHPSVAASFAVLIGGSLACAVLGAWICSQREFHVKTPEKG